MYSTKAHSCLSFSEICFRFIISILISNGFKLSTPLATLYMGNSKCAKNWGNTTRGGDGGKPLNWRSSAHCCPNVTVEPPLNKTHCNCNRIQTNNFTKNSEKYILRFVLMHKCIKFQVAALCRQKDFTRHTHTYKNKNQ